MKLTITDDGRDVVPGEVFYVGNLFPNIVSMLQEFNLLHGDEINRCEKLGDKIMGMENVADVRPVIGSGPITCNCSGLHVVRRGICKTCGLPVE